MTDHQHTADVLNRAADDLERNGWCTDIAGLRVAGPHCVMGAIGAAIELGASEDLPGHYSMTAVAAEPACGALGDYLGLPSGEVWRWNDGINLGRDRTAAEVIEVLRATAVIEQARADEHTATDTGYDTAAEMRAVAGDAAARTLAALR